MNKIKNFMIFAGLILCMMISGIFAYLTSTDGVVNTFEVGEVKIDVLEPSWEEGAVKHAVEMNEEVAKDPMIENIGENDAYVFMEVVWPKRNDLLLCEADGSAEVSNGATLLFTPIFASGYEDSWQLISQSDINDDRDVFSQVWAYASGGQLIPLRKGERTTQLFEKVKYGPIVEGQGLSRKNLEITVSGYAIQASNLNVTAPVDVWDILYRQTAQYGSAQDPYDGGVFNQGDYFISFDACGGQGAPARIGKYRGMPARIPEISPEREGYIFLGWSTQESGTVEYMPGDSFTTDANTSLYAIWEAE